MMAAWLCTLKLAFFYDLLLGDGLRFAMLPWPSVLFVSLAM